MLRAIQYPNLYRKWRTERKWVVHFRNIDNSKEKSSWFAVFITFLIYLKEEYFTEKKLKTSNPWQRNWFYIKMKWRCTKNPPSYKLLFNITLFNLFIWGLSSYSRIFTHMETSILPVKGCKFWPMLSIHCLWAVSVDSNTQHSACGANALTHCTTAAVNIT